MGVPKTVIPYGVVGSHGGMVLNKAAGADGGP